jgi:hypothetical protein
MTDGIIDLDKPTGYFEVAVLHYATASTQSTLTAGSAAAPSTRPTTRTRLSV